MRRSFISVLHVDTRWDFGRFCREWAEKHQQSDLRESMVPVFLNALTRNCRRGNFTWQYFESHDYTLQ